MDGTYARQKKLMYNKPWTGTPREKRKGVDGRLKKMWYTINDEVKQIDKAWKEGKYLATNMMRWKPIMEEGQSSR